MSWNVDENLCQTWANGLIQKHNPKRFTEPCKVDVYDLIDLVNARLSIDYLTPNKCYLGATVFNDVNFAVWPDYPYFPGMLPTFKFFRGRTIIIDRAFAESCEDIDIKRVNYTFPHEIFHLENHETKITAGYHVTQANEHGQKNTLEQEADYASSLFWMPKAAVENVFIEEFKLNLLPTMSLPFNYFTKPIIQKMAKIFDVNYSPMVYRLQELDLINRRWG